MLHKYKFTLLTLTALLCTLFGFGLAYTSIIKDIKWIALLGLAFGLFWTFTLFKSLKFQGRNRYTGFKTLIYPPMKLKNLVAYTICVASLSMFSCKEEPKDTTTTEIEVKVVSDSIEDEILDTSDDPILLGKTKRSQLHDEPYSKWFTPTYDEYVVDTATVKVIGRKLRDAHLTIFMGSWCEDSQLQIPAMFKVLDQAGFNPNHYTLVTVSEEKDTPKGLEKGKNITFVPTVIVNMEGKEIGRIVEYPIESWEKDLEKILNGEPYKHAYEE